MLSNIVNTTLQQSKEEKLLDVELHATPEDFEDEQDISDELTSNYYTAVAIDQHNNIYTTHNPDTTSILTKRDPQGNTIYLVNVSEQLDEICLINKIIPDNQDNIYLIGSRINTTDIEPTIYKYSSDGKLLWRRYKQNRDMDVPTYMKHGQDRQNQFEIATLINNVLYVAAFLSPRDLGYNQRVYIAAYSNQGKLLTSTISALVLDIGEIGYLSDMSHDIQGNVYITGGIETIEPPLKKAFILKLSPKLKPLQMEFNHEGDMTAYGPSSLSSPLITTCNITETITNRPLQSYIYKLTTDLKDYDILYYCKCKIVKALCVNNGRVVFIASDESEQPATLISIPLISTISQITLETPLTSINGYMLGISNLSVSVDGSIVVGGCVMYGTQQVDDNDLINPILLKYNSNLELQWSK